MSFDAPTAAEFKARFPDFASVDDTLVDLFIGESSSAVDASWIEADYQIARMFHAAHAMTLEGHGTSPQSKFAKMGDFSRVKSGDLELQRSSAQAGSGAAGETLTKTTYGQRFLELRRRSFPGVAIY